MTSHDPSSLPRRAALQLAAGGVLVGGAFAVGLTDLAVPAAHAETSQQPQPAREFRAMWIASVVNINFPSRTGLDAEAQKAEFRAWLDLAVELNLNAVISQVRPTADAFWPSPYEPWSRYLTGTPGGDPGYDPLAFQVEEAHARALEYHAWMNPFRVSMTEPLTDLAPDHPAHAHPDWTFPFAGKRYYNPGLPEVRAFVEDAMLHAVENYDIDALHFDDYFYPYAVAGKDYPDDAAYARYGNGAPRADWRRENINTLVREMQQRVHDLKPWVKFGISPFGIWRNSTSDPAGSATGGSESYEVICADTRRWVQQGWVDYIAPQIYWQIGLKIADYDVLARWWSALCDGTDVRLFIGQAVYKSTSGVFGPDELTRQVALNRSLPAIDGQIAYHCGDLRADAQGAVSRMVADHYSHPALVPTFPRLGGVPAPETPKRPRVKRRRGEVEVSWSSPRPHRTAAYYAIWSLPEAEVRPGDLEDGRNLVAVVRADDVSTVQSVTVPGTAGSGRYWAVTGLDRLWNASEPSAVARS